MKKSYLSLALLLTLVLCVFAFASCGKEKTDATTALDATAALTTAAGTTAQATTAEATTAAPTRCAHVPAAEPTVTEPATCTDDGTQAYFCSVCHEMIPGTTETIPAKGHTPETDYTVDADATCSADGSKSIHCAVCHEIIPGTAVKIDADPAKHVVTTWTSVKEPHLLDQNGHRSGVCSLCSSPVEEDLVWEPTIFNSKTYDYVSNGDPNYGTGSFYVSKNVTELLEEGQHYYPTEEHPEGHDLWFEYSILWNETLANYDGRLWDPVAKKFDENQESVIALVSFRKQEGDQGSFKDLYRLYTNDNKSTTCPYAGHLSFETYRPGMEPADSCVYDLGAGQTYKGVLDETVTADSFASIGEYGWHRIGFRFHQEALVEHERKYPKYNANRADGEIVQNGWSELYIDGVCVWKVETSMQGYWDTAKREWAERYDGIRMNAISLFNANNDTTDPDKAVYLDNPKLIVEIKLQNVKDCANPVIFVYDDVIWTCGDGFVRNVEPDPSPVAQTLRIADGVTVPATVYFKLAD